MSLIHKQEDVTASAC